jgi:hypothetical protein
MQAMVGLESIDSTTTGRVSSTYQLLDVAVHRVVHNRNFGRHLEVIDLQLGYKTEILKFNGSRVEV